MLIFFRHLLTDILVGTFLGVLAGAAAIFAVGVLITFLTLLAPSA